MIYDGPMKNVAILIFDEVEVLDFCGPFEVFSVAGRREGREPFNVYTVAETRSPVSARNNLSVNPAHSLGDCPRPDILIVPGGYGTRREMHNAALVEWIKQRADEAELVLSVCTGALLLAKAGLLEGLSATTHFMALDLLRETAPNTNVLADERIVDNGKVILSVVAVSVKKMSLYVVGKILGEGAAEETARYIEYDWSERGRRPATV